jgi:GT2 family glycosyltransferase
MRVLAHIHTFNDADIIDRTIESVLKQTRHVDGILVIDNASTDGTLGRPSLKNATVLRHHENMGTSGAVHGGFGFALEHGYDWIWVFDADSNPEPDALEKLLQLYAGWPQSQRDETCFLACLHFNVEDGLPRDGGLFTERGLAPNRSEPEARYYPCHFTVWSGCLYRLEAVRQIGLPNADYVLDWGEGEYGYRVMRAGYKGFICRDAVLHHNIRGYKSVRPVQVKRGSITVTVHEFPPIRCYYSCRNMLYFVLYEVAWGHRKRFLRSLAGPVKLTLSFLMRPRHHGKHLVACVRGIWDGITGNIAARY